MGHGGRAALGPGATDEGGGEVSTIPRALALLDLSVCIVTLDAAGCPSDTAEPVVEVGVGTALPTVATLALLPGCLVLPAVSGYVANSFRLAAFAN